MLCAALAALLSLSCKQKAIPPLPKIATASFPENVRGQVDTAVQVAVMNPDDAAATGRLAMVLHAYQQLDLAKLCYRRAHAMDPKALEWAYYLAVVEQIQGETPQAMEDAQAAVDIDSGSKPARMRLAESLLQGGKFKESQKLYEALVKEEPDRAVFRYVLGKVLAAQGSSIIEAIEQFKKATQLAPSFGQAHYDLALGFQQIGDQAASAREMTLWQANPSGAPPEDSLMAQISALNPGGLMRARSAQEYLAEGKPQDAAKQLETVIAANPKDEGAHSNLVLAYWQMKQPDKAQEHYSIAAGLNPNTASHFVFGLLMLDQHRYSEAGAAFRKALAANPRHVGANTQLGRVLQLQGDLDGASRQYGIALEADPDSRAANYLLGVVLLKQNQPAPAIEHLLKTLHPVDEKTPGYAKQLADTYRKSGDQDQAKKYDQMAGTATPDPETLAGQHDIPATGSSPGR